MDLEKLFDLQNPEARARMLKYSYILAYATMMLGFLLIFVFWDY
jgi:hypothetical protein